jgi:hypothetical protein
MWPTEIPPWFKVGCDNGWSTLKEETHKALVESRTTNKPGLRLADFVDLANYLADNKLLVLATDKNLGLSVVTKEWYLNQITTLFDDPKTYKVLSGGPQILVNRVKSFDETLTRLCVKFGSTLTNQEVKYMREPLAFLRYENAEGVSDTDLSLRAIGVIPHAYGIPKVHKKPWQLRPIVPFTKWIGRGASKVLSLRLQPFLKQFPVILTQSRQLVYEHIDRSFQPPTGYKLFIATGDISGMYTNVNSSIAVNTIRSISERFATKNEAHLNTELFSLVNDRLPMRIQGKGGLPTFLEQVSGLAMGANHSPDIANLYCALEEENWSDIHDQWLITYRRF